MKYFAKYRNYFYFFVIITAKHQSYLLYKWHFDRFLRNITHFAEKWKGRWCHWSPAVAKSSVAVIQRCSVKKVILQISQNSLEKTCIRVSIFNKVSDFRHATLLKKRLQHWCFPINITKSLRIAFFIEHLQWLLRVVLCEKLSWTV